MFGTIASVWSGAMKWSRLAIFIALLIGMPLHATTAPQSLQRQLGGGSGVGQDSDPVTLKAEFKLKPSSRSGLLIVDATVKEGWHTFSNTQKPGGPIPTKFTVAESQAYKVGRFVSTTKPAKKMDSTFEMVVEEHKGKVRWVAPIEIAKGVDVSKLKVKLVYNGGACENKMGGVCVPIFDVEKDAAFAGFDEQAIPSPAKIKLVPFEPEGIHAAVKGKVSASAAGPIKVGDTVEVQITVMCPGHYHVYAYGDPKSESFSKTTILFEKPDQWKLVGPRASEKPKVDKESFGPDDPIYYHENVTWTFKMVVPKNGGKLKGQMTLQTCKDTQCDPPLEIDFEADVPVGGASAVALKFAEADKVADSFKPADPVNKK